MSEQRRNATDRPFDPDRPTAAATLLRSLRAHGVEYVFGNFGTDHTPILEAAARIRDADGEDAIPRVVTCPHESAALSAAHGYAAATGEPQAVIVHVDVGTQNLGAMVHDAHRGDAPVFIIAGLAPVSYGDHPGARDISVHFLQDVFDQPGIVREFCRWTNEYRPPADPDELVVRGLELAVTPRQGPVYLSATREALETPVETALGSRSVEGVRPTPADPATVNRLASAVADADAPLVITSKLGTHAPEESVGALVEFAEAAGAGVVEQSPAALCFPRSHDLHLGFDPSRAFEEADLVLLADVDVPWIPGSGTVPPEDAPVVQVDVDPKKGTYPKWDFQVDDAVRADPAPTLAAVADRIDPADGDPGRERWREVDRTRREELSGTLAEHREAGRLTPEVLSDAIDGVVGDSTVVLNETTTNNATAAGYIDLDRPGSYYASHGSGLGWAPGAAIGVKLARPDARVLSLVGDGSYVFSNPTATAWIAGAHDAPTLTVVYNNSGWNAVRTATLREHPDGSAAAADVPESKFSPAFDLSHAAHVVDAHTEVVEDADRLDGALGEAVAAVDGGLPAVLDVRIEPI